MKKSLFFIVKPLELLGAIEAVIQLKIEQPILVYSCKDGIDKKTIEYLIQQTPFEWYNIIFVKPKPFYGYFWVKLLNRLKKEPFEYLFTRGFSISAYFIHNLNYEKHYLLDDGMATIIIAEEFAQNKNLNKRFSLFKGINKTGLKYQLITKIYLLFGIQVEKKVDYANFFTIYQLNPIENQKVITNQQKWVKSLKKEKQIEPDKDVIYLIGTDFVGAKFLTEIQYFNTVKKISEYYEGKKIIYIPHPREQNTFIDKIKSQGIVVQTNKLNIELDFLLNNIKPTHIAGTISTALITLKLMYQEDVTIDYFNLDENILDEDVKTKINTVRKYQSIYLNQIQIDY